MRTSVEGTLICCICIADINVKEGGHRGTNSRVANHDHRVADPDLGWTGFPIFSRCTEHFLNELYELFCIVNHDSWSNGMPAFRGKSGTVSIFHRLAP